MAQFNRAQGRAGFLFENLMKAFHLLVRVVTRRVQKPYFIRSALLVAALVVAAAPCRAQQPGPHDAEFHAFYADFLTAVRANDKNKIGELIAFPVRDWSVERKGNVKTVSIKDKAEFLSKYDLFFTAFMRSHALRAKPQKVNDDHYTLIWQDSNAEFSFEFEYIAGGGYRVTAYGIGPR